MDTTTLLIIIVILLLVGGGWYGRGRWYSTRPWGPSPLDFQQPVFEWSIRLSKSEAAFLL